MGWTLPARPSLYPLGLLLALGFPFPAFAAPVEISASVAGPVYGNSSDANGLSQPINTQLAEGHSVAIKNGGVVTTGDVYGARAADSSGTVTAKSNTVTISGTVTSGDVYGAYATGGTAPRSTDNTVTISSGMVGGSIYGGYTTTGSADDNKVNISGGTVSGNIYGGYASSGTGSATTNKVTISTSGATYKAIYGGAPNGTGDLFTGNTLNLAAGNSIFSVQNFETINFTSAGVAGIDMLDTAPTGASGLVKLNTNSYEITFSGPITSSAVGSGGINKQGAGKLILSGTNDYDGGTTVSDGTLQLGNGTGAGSIAGNIYTNSASANVTFNHSTTVPYDGVISGNGSLTQAGVGRLILSGENTYTGDTTVESEMQVTGTGKLGTGGSYAGKIINNGTLLFTQTVAQTLSGVISGSGALTQNSDTGVTLTLSGMNTYRGETTISTGTLALSGSGSIANSSGVSLADDPSAIFDISAVNSGTMTTINGLTGGDIYGGNVTLGIVTK
ncbi:hypothetical protein AGMMS50256_23660 [Betaproteobacteria bacterium]|nr:hypothetical protein AGMMS50256_23660 [Betaproteobacteria bacterium]